LVVSDDHPRKLGRQIGGFRDYPDASFRSFRARYGATDIGSPDVHALLGIEICGYRDRQYDETGDRHQTPKRFGKVQHGSPPEHEIGSLADFY